MKISNWEAWYTYSSFIPHRSINLTEMAHRFVLSGVAASTFHSDGMVWWSDDGGVRHHSISLAQVRSDGRFQLPPDASELSAYELEGIGQSVRLRASELDLFKIDGELRPRYLRAVLPPYRLERPHGLTTIYPHIKVFESGVASVELRVFSAPKNALDLNEFINGIVRLPMINHEVELAPPATARLSPIATRIGSGYPFWKRAIVAWFQHGHAQGVLEEQSSERCGDFVHDFVEPPQSAEPVDLKNVGRTLLALTALFTEDHPLVHLGRLPERRGEEDSSRWSVGDLLQAARYVIGGEPAALEQTRFWSGRRHFHLIDYEGQAPTATENEQQWGEEFGWIMAGGLGDSEEVGKSFLPDDLRRFDDFGLYINKPTILWAHAQRSLASRPRAPGGRLDRGSMVFEHQVIGEVLDYAYALHRKLAYQAKRSDTDIDRVLETRRRLVEFREALTALSGYGEVENWLKRGFEATGTNELNSVIEESLSVREASAQLTEQRQRNRFAAALSMIVALAALVPLANNVVAPLWRWAGWPAPQSQPAADLFPIALTFGLLLILIVMGMRWAQTPIEDAR